MKTRILAICIMFFAVFSVDSALGAGVIRYTAEGGMVFGGGLTANSSPVQGASMTSNPGFRARAGIQTDDRFEYGVGFERRSHDLGLQGANLGRVGTTTIEGSARYRPDIGEFSQKFKPYVGVGLHHTSVNQTSLAGGLNNGGTSFAGPMIEAGGRVPVFDGWYADLNATKRFGGGSAPITVFGIPVTSVSMKNPFGLNLSFGREMVPQ